MWVSLARGYGSDSRLIVVDSEGSDGQVEVVPVSLNKTNFLLNARWFEP